MRRWLWIAKATKKERPRGPNSISVFFFKMAEERTAMEESLLLGKEVVSKTESHGEEERKKKVISKDIYLKEMKRICSLSGPMVAIGLSQYMLQVVSIIIVGHLGELDLASTALSISFTTVTGFSFLVLSTYFIITTLFYN